MRIRINAVGRAKRDPTDALFKEYVKRLPWQTDLKEIEARGKLGASERRSRECTMLVDALPSEGLTVALDSRGKPLSSEKLAARLSDWQDSGVQYLAFLIGGADGLDDNVLKRADTVLSLGEMTWPHMLVRVMLAEQLYRASTIISGHPYHRGG